MILNLQLAASYGGNLLALDPSAIGRAVTGAAEPGTARTGRVAVVRIRGPLLQRAEATMCGGRIDGYDAVGARFQAALDSDASSVLLDIDSPGGSVAGLFETVRAMRAAKRASGKRVVAFANELAASAAFGLASVADEVVVPQTGEVGSIGVIAVHSDLSDAAKKAGIKWTVVRSPRSKAERSPFEPLGSEPRNRWQAEINDLAQQFAALVGAGIGKTADQLLKLDGRVFRGAEAVGAGLAHRVGGIDLAMSLALPTTTAARPVRAEVPIMTTSSLPPLPAKPNWAARVAWRRAHGEEAYKASVAAETAAMSPKERIAAEFRAAKTPDERAALIKRGLSG